MPLTPIDSLLRQVAEGLTNTLARQNQLTLQQQQFEEQSRLREQELAIKERTLELRGQEVQSQETINGLEAQLKRQQLLNDVTKDQLVRAELGVAMDGPEEFRQFHSYRDLSARVSQINNSLSQERSSAVQAYPGKSFAEWPKAVRDSLALLQGERESLEGEMKRRGAEMAKWYVDPKILTTYRENWSADTATLGEFLQVNYGGGSPKEATAKATGETPTAPAPTGPSPPPAAGADLETTVPNYNKQLGVLTTQFVNGEGNVKDLRTTYNWAVKNLGAGPAQDNLYMALFQAYEGDVDKAKSALIQVLKNE